MSIGSLSIPRDASSSRREWREDAKGRALNSSEWVGMLLCATIASNFVAIKSAAEPEAGDRRLANRSPSGGSERSRRQVLAVGGVEQEVVDCAGSTAVTTNISIVTDRKRKLIQYI